MRILLTNDDGIHAAGLKLLEAIARELSDDVTVVAPENDQSGVAHSLSLSDPLRLREIGPRHFAVKGTPTDCVIMGVRRILADRPPDLVLSGVNRGQNVAEDVTYSGTIAGAMEGAMLGIPSIALSQAYGGAVGRARSSGTRRRRTPRRSSARFSPPESLPAASSTSTSPPAPRRGGGDRLHPSGPPQRRTDAGRGAARRPRLSLLLAHVPARRVRAGGWDGSRGAGARRRFRSRRSGSISPTMIRACGSRRLLRGGDAEETTGGMRGPS